MRPALPLAVAAAVVLAVVPAPSLAQMPVPPGGSLHWTCEYRVSPKDMWSARCYDAGLLAAYDPVADVGAPIVWDVPLWGPPMSDDRAMELVRAVLCRRNPCEVLLQRGS